MIVFRTAICFVRLFFYLFRLNGNLKKVQKLKNNRSEHDKLVSKHVKEWAEYVLKISGVNVSVSGISNIPSDETVILVCNHQSFYDIPVLLASLDKPYGLLSKDSVKKIPFINKWMDELNCVFINRDNPKSAINSLSLVGDNLDNGYSMIIFPEGTRSKSSKLLKFRSGAFRLAVSKNVSIVPIVLNGTYKIFETNHNLIKPGNVTLKILPKIQVSKDSDYKTLLEDAYNKISQNL